MSNRIFLSAKETLHNKHENELLRLASEYIIKGDVVLFPTDTTYALGANAINELAVKKVYNLKIRSPRKPMHVIVANIKMASEYVFLTKEALQLAETFLPGPLTIVLRHRGNIPSILVSGLLTLGIRIPDNEIALALSRLSNVPITATSANISGQSEVYNADDFIKQLSVESQSFESGLIIDQGHIPLVKPSTIVDLSGNIPIVLREGPITKKQIFECVNIPQT
jgi:L-threonylcarbamoyladenylate synthase